MTLPRNYVAEQISTIIGEPVQPANDIVMRWWEALTCVEERSAPTDTHGKIVEEAIPVVLDGHLESPPLHADITWLQQRHPQAPPRWPHGHRFAACLTHDVDRITLLPWRERWRQLVTLQSQVPLQETVRRSAATLLYAGGSLVGLSPQHTYDYWIDEEARWGFHSTFFVLPEYLLAPTTYDHYYHYDDRVTFRQQPMTFAEATRHVREEGWEISLHGSYASAFDQRILRHEKAQVETMLNAPVTTTRQHFLRFDVTCTPHYQAQAGFLADTTLGFSRYIGCRAGLAFPFFWADEEELLEVPLIMQDIALLRKAGRFDVQAELARAKTLIERIAEDGGVVSLSWHTFPLERQAPDVYRTLLEIIADLDGWGCSMSELHAWWHARRAMVRARQHRPTATSCSIQE